MKRIIFRKIFTYDPTFGGKYSIYQGYCPITLQKRSPGIAKDLNIEVPLKLENVIFASSLKRGVETANLLAKKYGIKKVLLLDDLKEVIFDLQDFLSEKEFEKEGSNLVRKKFIESFIKDKLVEKRSRIEARIQKIFDDLNKYPNGNYLLISHSFFMKILQIYLKNKDLFKNPEILRKEFNYRLKTFEFGEGFEYNL